MELLTRIIIHNELPIFDMPPVQFSTLIAFVEEDIVLRQNEVKSNMIDVSIEELVIGVTTFNVPSKD